MFFHIAMREFFNLFFLHRQTLFIIYDSIIAKKHGFHPKNLEPLTNKALVNNFKSWHKKSLIFQFRSTYLKKIFEEISFFSKEVYILCKILLLEFIFRTALRKFLICKQYLSTFREKRGLQEWQESEKWCHDFLSDTRHARMRKMFGNFRQTFL